MNENTKAKDAVMDAIVAGSKISGGISAMVSMINSVIEADNKDDKPQARGLKKLKELEAFLDSDAASHGSAQAMAHSAYCDFLLAAEIDWSDTTQEKLKAAILPLAEEVDAAVAELRRVAGVL